VPWHLFWHVGIWADGAHIDTEFDLFADSGDDVSVSVLVSKPTKRTPAQQKAAAAAFKALTRSERAGVAPLATTAT